MQKLEDSMNKSEAYKIVYEDMIKRDKRNSGDIEYSEVEDGIYLVMRQIAFMAGKEDEFEILYASNGIHHEEMRAKSAERKADGDGWKLAQNLIEIQYMNNGELPYYIALALGQDYAENAIHENTQCKVEEVLKKFDAFNGIKVGVILEDTEDSPFLVLHVDPEDGRIIVFSLEFDSTFEIGFKDIADGQYKVTDTVVESVPTALREARSRSAFLHSAFAHREANNGSD